MDKQDSKENVKEMVNNHISSIVFPVYFFLLLVFFFKSRELEQLKEKIYNLELENSKLNYNSLKLQEELQQLSSQLITSNENTTESQRPISEESGHNKDSAGSESPERFEIIDKNMSIFKEDNISNSSFNASDWMNLSIPVDNRDCDSSGECKLRDIELNTRLV